MARRSSSTRSGTFHPRRRSAAARPPEERQIERLGSPEPIAVSTHGVIAATHRNLEQRIAQGAFREDLYYRLNVFPIHVPPLRERPEDIPLLVWRFVEEFSKSFGKRVDLIADDSMAALQQYEWPGNLRELRNVVERAMITSQGSRLTIRTPETLVAASQRSQRLVDVEREHTRRVLEAANWRIREADGAAERLGGEADDTRNADGKAGPQAPCQQVTTPIVFWLQYSEGPSSCTGGQFAVPAWGATFGTEPKHSSIGSKRNRGRVMPSGTASSQRQSTWATALAGAPGISAQCPGSP